MGAAAPTGAARPSDHCPVTVPQAPHSPGRTAPRAKALALVKISSSMAGVHAAGKGVLLAWVVAAEEQHVRLAFAAAAPSRRRARTPGGASAPRSRACQHRPERLPGEPAQADDHPQGRGHHPQLGREPGDAACPAPAASACSPAARSGPRPPSARRSAAGRRRRYTLSGRAARPQR